MQLIAIYSVAIVNAITGRTSSYQCNGSEDAYIILAQCMLRIQCELFKTKDKCRNINAETGPYNILFILPFHLRQVHAAVTGFLPLLAFLVLQEERKRKQEVL